MLRYSFVVVATTAMIARGLYVLQHNQEQTIAKLKTRPTLSHKLIATMAENELLIASDPYQSLLNFVKYLGNLELLV